MFAATSQNSALADLDAPEASEEHARLIREKPLLKKIYRDHYKFFARELRGTPAGAKVELGSGGGFVRDLIPNMICSDVVRLSSTQMTFSALELPFCGDSLGALCMINVLHHLPRVRNFFSESVRCLAPGGKLIMIEPANTLLSRFIFSNFHHEPFDPEQAEWEFPSTGRMSSANDALPWIIFSRDRLKFEREFPRLHIARAEPIHPFRYLISGGLTLPSLLPAALYPMITGAEWLASPLHAWLGMFMRIVVVKK